MEKIQTVIKKGKWIYSNSIAKEVAILKQNWDYYYEDGYSEGKPELNNEGFAFYVVFDVPLEDGRYVSRSETLYSIESAIEYAESKVGKIVWNN